MANLIETRNIADALLREHGLTAWSFQYDNAKKRGGQCNHTFRRITMSKHLVPMWSDAEVKATLMHEIAHALVGPGHGHGRVWAAKMRELGQKPERCHDNAVAEPPFVAMCATHGEIGRRHRRTRGGLCARCRTAVTWVDTRLVRV